MIPPNPKKRPRATHTRHSSSISCVSSTASFNDDASFSHTSFIKLRRTSSHPALPSPSSLSFNDRSTADVILRLYPDSSSVDGDATASGDLHLFLHSQILRRAKYFSAVLSDRWQNLRNDCTDVKNDKNELISLNLAVHPSDVAFQVHLTVLELLYSEDFDSVINSVENALDVLAVALELLFEECVKRCVSYLEAVPWNEEEERRVMNLIPFMSEEEAKELSARASPSESMCEEMLQGLINSAIYNQSNMAFVKAFVAKLLREFSSKDSVRKVLERAFKECLKVVKESLEEYSSPDFRGYHNETEVIQRVNLHTAMTNGRHLVWIVERMIELKVAEKAVKEWSDQGGFTGDLQRAFRDDAWRNFVPGLPSVVLRCTCKLAVAVASGSILVSRQVRKKLVKDWLPVLIVCKDKVSPMLPSQRQLYQELEETFLRIISTLPMSDAQELLQQCLSFSTRNVEDCPHLVTAFNTWFRRAARSPQGENI